MSIRLPKIHLVVTATNADLEFRLRAAILDATVATLRTWLLEQPRDPEDVRITASVEESTGAITFVMELC